jgi:putative acetyltransferase
MSVLIRAGESRDAEAIRTIYAQPQACLNTLQLPFPTLERWQTYCAQPEPDSYNLVAEIEGRVVGQLYLLTYAAKPRRKHVATLGLGVHDAYTGRGAGSALIEAAVTLCDQWLNIQRIELEVYADNATAIHVYQKFGFEQEGLLRQYAFRNGSYVDVLMMARLHTPL